MVANHSTSNCDALSSDARDTVLLARAKHGDHHAFEQLVEPYLRKLLDAIHRITRHREDAEDCLQNALIRAFTCLDQFKGASRFSTWLFTIGVNQALMCLRSKRRARCVPDPSNEGSLPFAHLADTRPDPEAQYHNAELSKALHEVIQLLPPGFRPVFEMRYVHELSNEEAAAALDMTVPTIKTRAFRARRQLRERLARRYGVTRSK
jgi:RNA polymerase sigma-70 factor, ECF subfamily